MNDKSKATEDRDSQRDFVRPPSIEAKNSRWGIRGKTFWDWLQLLIVPIVLSLITVAFTWQQERQQQRFEQQRTETARYVEDQRAQDEALQAYFDQMSTLLLKEELREAPVGSEVRMLARARTLTILSRVDSYRKRSVLLFLNDSRLINKQQQNGTAGEANDPVVSLEAADLREAKLKGSNVVGAANFGASEDTASQTPSQTPMDAITMPGADLSGVNLSGSDLRGTSLLEADLTRTDLSDARLKNANFTGADLTDAVLTGAEGLSAEELKRQAASLQGATMPDGQRGTAATQLAPSAAPEIEPEGEVRPRHPASKAFPEPAGETPPPAPPE